MLTMTSWRTALVLSFILSNSSMQQIPLSLNTRAPLFIKKQFFFSSAIIAIHTIILHILVNTWNTLSFYNIESSYLRLQDQLSCLWVPSHISGQTNSWRSLARCILTPRNKVVHVLKAKEQVQTAEFK